MSKLALPVVTLALLALGCPAEPEEQETEGGTGSSTATDGATGGTGATSVVDGTAESGDSPVDVPARGIQVRLVELNAGVATAIGLDGEWVPGEDRNAAITRNRETVFRVRVDVDEAVWVPRDIEARLVLHMPDGTSQVFSAVETIAGDSPEDDTSIESNFFIAAPPEVMVSLLQFEVLLFEGAEAGWEGLPEPAPEDPRLPSGGPAYVGVESSPMNMRLVLVPIEYDGPGCTATFETLPEVIAEYEDIMFQHNPLETIEMEIHDPYLVDDLDLSDANDFFMLLNRIQQLRASERPDPNVYYYGIFDNCAQCVGFDGFEGCVLGVAAGLPDDSMGSAGERAAIGASELDHPAMGLLDIGPATFVHEIGHTQGRQHVACPGVQAGGPDPSYPHDEGRIGVWGYGVLDAEIRGADTHTDYMSYCNPTWVSDWQWNATFNRIRTLSSWDAADIAELDQHAVLVGAVNPVTGEARWWTDRGWLTSPEPDHTMRLWDGDQLIEQTPVQVSRWSEGPWMTVRAPLTAAFDQATELELVEPTRSYRAPRSSVAVYHQPDALTGEVE